MSTSRPMIMSGPMIRALLAARKSQTRRLLKLPSWAQPDSEIELDEGWPLAISRRTGCLSALRCPYGAPGDEIWVKETWCQAHPLAFQEGRIGRRLLYAGIPGPPPVDYLVAYRADGELLPIWYSTEHPYRQLTPPDDLARESFPDGVEDGWESPIFMPRKASRLTLRITDIRAERLQDISEADAIAEGCPAVPLHSLDCNSTPPSEHFRALWESIHGTGSWTLNPVVWRIAFERVAP